MLGHTEARVLLLESRGRAHSYPTEVLLHSGLLSGLRQLLR